MLESSAAAQPRVAVAAVMSEVGVDIPGYVGRLTDEPRSMLAYGQKGGRAGRNRSPKPSFLTRGSLAFHGSVQQHDGLSLHTR